MTELDNPNITIVTAFFDLNRTNWQVFARATETYFEWFVNLATLANPMVVYTSPEFGETVMRIRTEAGHGDRTTVVTVANFTAGNEGLLELISRRMNNQWFQRFVEKPVLPERWNYNYVLMTYLKHNLVKHAIDNGFVGTDLAAWVDFGFVRSPDVLGGATFWGHPFDPGRMHIWSVRPIDPQLPIFEVVRSGLAYLMAGTIVGTPEMWREFADRLDENIKSLLACGLVDDEQTTMLMAYLEDPEFFDLHEIDADRHGWFVAFKHFNEFGAPPDSEASPTDVPPEPRWRMVTYVVA